MPETLKAPFPWFGGKSPVAQLVWDRLGDVDNYIEPFAGSAAMLLRRPHAPRVETINDRDCYVANFWRATQHDPEGVAAHADYPVNETDLHSRHRWLVLSDDAVAFRRRMRTDPHYFDARIAGWWCWGQACWIGGGWCSTPEDETAVNDTRPDQGSVALWQIRPRLGDVGIGVHSGEALRQGRPQLADAHARGRGVHGNDRANTCEQRRAWLLSWFNRLRDRLRCVRVCCGDWLRVCDSHSVTTRLGLTGVFLDPPYGAASGRDAGLYAVDSLTVAEDVRRWCLERGGDPQMRIVLCGYGGEGHEALEAHNWTVEAWKTNGGYANRAKSRTGNVNAAKERIWFSPHCQGQRGLFDGLESSNRESERAK